jgi:hypothetical protein
MTAQNRMKIPKKADANKKASWFITVCELASKGISNSSIAAQLGLSMTEFTGLLEYEQNGIKPVKQAIEIARSNFEIERARIKDEILMKPETSDALKIKIVRDDLKTLEAWAPATRAIKVQVESAQTEYNFESFTESELTDIVARSTGATDAKN